MARAFKCDKCGEFHEGDPGHYAKIPIKGMGFTLGVLVLFNPQADNQLLDPGPDLCTQCLFDTVNEGIKQHYEEHNGH